MFQVEASIQNNTTSKSPQNLEAAQETAAECLDTLAKLEGDSEAKELSRLLTKPWVESLLSAHDNIAAASSSNHQNQSQHYPQEDGNALLERLQHYEEPNIKVVRIEKTSESLGATVKNDGEAVIVARIIRGGTAEASGLLHEGDEILEVNEVELRGKDVNEVCEILARMSGTMTFLVVPTRHHLSVSPNVGMNVNGRLGVVHLKAHIDYDPEDDPYIPCRELGISFQKGDIVHVINQRDPHWWQARRDGEESETLAGLIPSANFLQQREAMKHTIAHDVENFDGGSNSLGSRTGFRRAKSGFLCAKKSGRGKKGRKNRSGVHPGYGPDEELEPDEIVTYEEVALYYPRSDRKRPVVLIGPPNIGRHELRQRLMLDTERFAAAIPRKFMLRSKYVDIYMRGSRLFV